MSRLLDKVDGPGWLALLGGSLLLEALSVAATPSGQIVGWGELNFPYVEPGMTFTNIAAGGNQSAALQRNGIAVGWGYNFYKQCSGMAAVTNVMAVAMGYFHTLVLRTDGTVAAFGAGVTNSAGLSPASWLPVPGAAVQGTGREASLTDTNAPGPRRFYRLVETD